MSDILTKKDLEWQMNVVPNGVKVKRQLLMLATYK